MIRNQKNKIAILAQQGAQVQLQQTGSITSTMRRFCQESRSWTSPAAAAAAAATAATSTTFNPPGLSQIAAKIKVPAMEKAKKLIGFKKTLVNEMQGLKTTSASVALRKTYKVFGKNKYFSSSSSMLARCPSSMVVINPRRYLSLKHNLLAKQQLAVQEQQQQYPYCSITKATTSASQRGFNQAYNRHADVIGRFAKEIGDSIKEELMVIDDNTKQILRYNANDYPKRQQTDSFYDPLHGWNHPRPLNVLTRREASFTAVTAPTDEANARDEEIARRAKPRQRRNLCKNYNTISSEGLGDGKGQLGQLHSPPSKERLSDFRYGNRKMSATNTTISNHLLDRPSKTTVRPQKEEEEDTEKDRYKQPLAERQFLEKTIWGNMGKKASHMRLDDFYYPQFSPADGERTGVATPGVESAAQRVISNQHVDVPSRTGKSKKRAKKARPMVGFVDPVPKFKPLLGLPSEPPFLRRRVARPVAAHHNVKKTIIKSDIQRTKRNQTMRPLVMPVYNNTPIAAVQKSQSKLDSIMTSTKRTDQENGASPMIGQQRNNKKKSTKSKVNTPSHEWEMEPSASKQTFYVKESAVQRIKASCPSETRNSHIPYMLRANRSFY